MKTYVVNGRVVSQQTRWWVLNGQADPQALYCIHNKALSDDCAKCEAAA